jgi:hypothetical protein
VQRKRRENVQKVDLLEGLSCGFGIWEEEEKEGKARTKAGQRWCVESAQNDGEE